MKRNVWLALAGLAVVAAGVSLVALPKGPEWTTSSPEALAEFEEAMTAQMKLYEDEAAEHLARAVELDPDFVMAKLMYSDYLAKDDKEAAEKIWNEIASVDISGLTPREQFFVERFRIYHGHEDRPYAEKREAVDKLIDEYLAAFPNDPYILHQKALRKWVQGDLEEAERLNRRLTEISPNWVIAYNQLGYITMMEGRFAESEENFKSYRFIAPDQANPYDSLGELFITLGRYGEAEESLEKALEIKPDFWASYQHLALLKNMTDDFEGAYEISRRARELGAPDSIVAQMDCFTRYSQMRARNEWRQILDERDSLCMKKVREGHTLIVTHTAACKLGEWEIARGIEDQFAEWIDKASQSGNRKSVMSLKGGIAHMEGVRMALQGDLAGAEQRLREADEELMYTEAGVAMYKLYNRVFLAEILLAQGKDAEAHQLLAKVRSVNPTLVAEFEDAGHSVIGLRHG